MAVPFSNTKLRVPKGFQNVLEGLAREVLRNQPENLYEFGAKYFEQMLSVRDGKKRSTVFIVFVFIMNVYLGMVCLLFRNC